MTEVMTMDLNRIYQIGRFLLVSFLVWSMTACQSDEEPDSGIEMPVVITVPADNREARVPGDPGIGIEYPLPRHALIYMAVTHTGSGQSVISSEQVLHPRFWKYVADGNFYRYDSSIRIRMPHNVLSGRIFVVLSQEKLTVNNDNPQTQQEVERLQFDLERNPHLNLKDLYANPVNDRDTKQNGTIVRDGQRLRAMVRCYHVAAKVDMMWNINPDKQNQYKMQELKLINLPTTGHFFYPTTDNVAGQGQNLVLGEGSTPVTPANQWFGRAVTYVLQPQGGRLDWNITYSASKPDGESAFSQPDGGLVSDAFTAWYRINARIGYSELIIQ